LHCRPAGRDRNYALDLTGNMASYIWSISEQVYPKADDLVINPGDRVRVDLTNKTGMWHPMHLHGHFFRLLPAEGDNSFAPLKHTVSVPPRQTVRLEFLADNPGTWFFHWPQPLSSGDRHGPGLGLRGAIVVSGAGRAA
jgi:FtsP/CotA-like multicopper oxidase with cupredoxin domain